MKIVNNKIIETTKDELFIYYLKRELDDVYSFNWYVKLMEEAGVIIDKTDKKGE